MQMSYFPELCEPLNKQPHTYGPGCSLSTDKNPLKPSGLEEKKTHSVSCHGQE